MTTLTNDEQGVAIRLGREWELELLNTDCGLSEAGFRAVMTSRHERDGGIVVECATGVNNDSTILRCVTLTPDALRLALDYAIQDAR